MVVPFPIAWSWTIRLPRRSSPSADVQSVVELLAEALRREGAKIVVVRPAAVDFKCPGVAGMSRWALLAPISGGSVTATIDTDSLKLSYSLRFMLFFWAALAFAAIFAVISGREDPIKVGVLTFSWLFFGNVAISLFRFPAFLRRVLSGSSPPNTSLERTRER